MLSLVLGKKSRTEDLQRCTQESNISMSIWGMQAALLTSATLTAEVNALKQSLERSENELGLAKRQLEEDKGKLYPVYILIRKNKGGCLDHRIVMNFARGHDRSGGPEEGAVRGRRQSGQGAP